jgi:3-oxoacyl-(acyl-carrier-protein) synthase
MRSDVVVTGLGVASAAGCDVAAFWERVRMGVSAIRHTVATPDHVPPAPYEAAVEDGALDRAAKALGIRSADRVVRLASVACQEAWLDANLPLPAGSALGARAGVILGSGLGGIQFQEEQMLRVLRAHEDRIHPHTVPRVSSTALVTEVAQALALRGLGFVVSNACASSAHALGQAMRAIACGEADVMVAGGAEAPLTHFSMTAFSLLGVLAKAPGEPSAQPLAHLGFLLESPERAVSPGKHGGLGECSGASALCSSQASRRAASSGFVCRKGQEGHPPGRAGFGGARRGSPRRHSTRLDCPSDCVNEYKFLDKRCPLTEGSPPWASLGILKSHP